MKKKVIFSWSGGKDSALALYELVRSGEYDIAALLTTVTKDYDRISMHGVRTVLLEKQAKALGITLEKALMKKGATIEENESKIREVMQRYFGNGVLLNAAGDIALEDVKKYKDDNLARIGMEGVYPLWKRGSAELARRFIVLGFKSVITCVDTALLDKSFVGREFDASFLADLPAGVDPCGENGEFHSFVYDGPIFREKVDFTKGEIVLRDNRYYFCDLLPN
ncbi:MAG TPA: diphthine--ammonia ligase [Candidatus Omnitrophota bacterium]|nr:diphthine--ammonia ligase [Candidatus Omnitrophota bacterium]HOX09648.1 diphthine--ammonia ligase [Candidatus Omnitrophota bacterium]HPN66305.1 diphthine--ammonia ligase [Candidatus Omnitrophota bacterium]HRZ66712.1 diphthine--ammonia ligase [Candidatus Omnitrophota bacterium]